MIKELRPVPGSQFVETSERGTRRARERGRSLSLVLTERLQRDRQTILKGRPSHGLRILESLG